MTRAEAIEELKTIRFSLNYKVNGTSHFDGALAMAIEALEEEPTQTQHTESVGNKPDALNNALEAENLMTLDEAICHAEQVMMEQLEKTRNRNANDPVAHECFRCADEHRQLAKWLKDYKRLLKQEPTDCISRGKVLDLINAVSDDYGLNAWNRNAYLELFDTVDTMPSVQPKHGEWISVEDELPSGLVDVLVTCFIHENWQVKYGYYNGSDWVIGAYGKDWKDLEVIAWMELPKPYKQI